MNSVTADGFAGLVVLALERMAFVVLEPSHQSVAEALARAVAHASITIEGGERYQLAVSVTPGVVREVAAGMMGLDTDEIDVDDHACATAAELANILAGELVMLLTSGDSPMVLGLPRELDDEGAGACFEAAAISGFSSVFECDAGTLSFALQVV